MGKNNPLQGALEEAGKQLTSDPAKSWKSRIEIPKTDDELHTWVKEYLNLDIPRNSCCPEHTSPFDAMAEAYFARSPRTIWYASRLVGKTVLLAALSTTEALTLGANVTLLGGSSAQSHRVHAYLSGTDTNLPSSFLHAPDAPMWLVDEKKSTKSRTLFKNGGSIVALQASQRSVRGAHPQRTRLDEIDEMDLSIYDAASGQAVPAKGIREQQVGSSTWHQIDGTMTKEIKRARRMGWPVRTWCLPPEGKVLTDRGLPVRIDSIKIGDRVLTGEGRARVVSALFRRDYDGEMTEFEVQGYPDAIKLTSNHKLPTQRGWITAGELAEGDYVLDPRSSFEDGGSFEDGWLIGFFLADGLLNNVNSLQFSTHVTQVDQVLNHLNSMWEKRNPGSGKFGSDGPRVFDCSHSSKVKVIQASHQGIRRMIGEWVDFENQDLNGPRQGSFARVKRLRKLPTQREFARGILLGWMFGDGGRCANDPERRVGDTASEDLAWQMNRIGLSLGYSSSMRKYKNRPGPDKRAADIPDDLDIWRIGMNSFSLPVHNKNRVSFYECRQEYATNPDVSKRELGRRYGVKWDTISRWLGWDGQPNKRQPRLLGNSYGREVKNIKRYSYKGKVHDITVEEDHTFLAGGITVSNCYRCVLESNGGFLSDAFIERKKASVPVRTWEVEYELSRPSPEGSFIHEDAIKFAFNKDLGEFDGDLGASYTFEEPVEGATFSTGADWARDRDRTIILTFRTDVDPIRLVQYDHMGHVPFPVMVAKFNEIVAKYDSYACHDATGLGSVLHDYIEVASEGVVLQGKRRTHIFSQYVKALEQRELVFPHIQYMQEEHEYAIVGDLYGSGHPPDTIVAAALAYRAAETLDLIY